MSTFALSLPATEAAAASVEEPSADDLLLLLRRGVDVVCLLLERADVGPESSESEELC